MELRHLRYFLAVAEERNFTRAAERCFVAQSALSQQIARLEKEVGAPLFVRGNRSIELTSAGEVLLPYAERIIATAENAKAELDALNGLRKGRLRVGVLQTSASAVDTIGLLGEYHERYPDIEIHVVNQASAEMVQAVLAGELDLALVGLTGSDLPDALSQQLLAVDPLVAVLSEKAAEGLHDEAALADIVPRGQFIHFREGSGIRRHVDEALFRAGLQIASSFETDQTDDLVNFAGIGLGVTVVPLALAIRMITDASRVGAQYRIVRLIDPQAVHPVSVVHDARRLSSAAQAFLDILPAHLRRTQP